MKKFQIEELEKRYEMKTEWFPASGDYYDGDGNYADW